MSYELQKWLFHQQIVPNFFYKRPLLPSAVSARKTSAPNTETVLERDTRGPQELYPTLFYNAGLPLKDGASPFCLLPTDDALLGVSSQQCSWTDGASLVVLQIQL
jgi:hypothetical protein